MTRFEPMIAVHVAENLRKRHISPVFFGAGACYASRVVRLPPAVFSDPSSVIRFSSSRRRRHNHLAEKDAQIGWESRLVRIPCRLDLQAHPRVAVFFRRQGQDQPLPDTGM